MKCPIGLPLFGPPRSAQVWMLRSDTSREECIQCSESSRSLRHSRCSENTHDAISPYRKKLNSMDSRGGQSGPSTPDSIYSLISAASSVRCMYVRCGEPLAQGANGVRPDASRDSTTEFYLSRASHGCPGIWLRSPSARHGRDLRQDARCRWRWRPHGWATAVCSGYGEISA